MAITTSIAPSYAWRMIFIAVLCAVFGLWGAYDYWVAIPRQEAIYAEYEAAKSEAARVEKLALSQPLSDQDRLAFEQATATVNRLAPTGAAPVRPGKWDRLTQWFFISCLPFTFYGIWLYRKAKRQVFQLDEQGTLHFTGDAAPGSGAWTQAEIADIDMSRWMAKSIAYAVHIDGSRLKLDAYLHKNLDVIIGAISSRLHPDQWDEKAKPIKAAEEEPAPAA